MSPKKPNFKYGKSHKIVNWGCSFDSLTELKYAISIRDEFEFMRGRVHIYYNQGTLKPTNYIRTGIKHYTPDFLIRHKKSNEAWLVEIKPRAFEHEPQLILRREIAQNYIRWKKYDWQFKVIFDDQIFLDEHNLQIFEDCCKLKSQSAFRIWMEQENKRYDRSAPSFFKQVLTNQQVSFIMFGNNKPRAA